MAVTTWCVGVAAVAPAGGGAASVVWAPDVPIKESIPVPRPVMVAETGCDAGLAASAGAPRDSGPLALPGDWLPGVGACAERDGSNWRGATGSHSDGVACVASAGGAAGDAGGPCAAVAGSAPAGGFDVAAGGELAEDRATSMVAICPGCPASDDGSGVIGRDELFSVPAVLMAAVAGVTTPATLGALPASPAADTAAVAVDGGVSLPP
jgi:hypothetical protein